jgi:hypothetical protein
MDLWDVSAVTDFSGMFRDLTVKVDNGRGLTEYTDANFNEPIGDWDVSSGTDFVSNDEGVRFAFEVHVFSTKLYYCPFFSNICLVGPQALINPLVTGMSRVVSTL